MKKILIVNCVFDPEPVVSAQVGKDLAQELGRMGNTVTVIAPSPSRPFGFEFDGKSESEYDFDLVNLKSYVYPQSGILGRLIESISFGVVSFKYIVSHSSKVDIVYMNTWPIFAQFAVAIASKLTGIPYKVHIQDIYPESITNKLSGLASYLVHRILMPLDSYVLRNAEKIIVISNNMKKYLVDTRELSESKFEVILNWQDDSFFGTFQKTWYPGMRTFMYLGNIGPVAGIPFVIEAFAKAALSNSRLVIAGSGSARKACIELAKKFSDANIQFIEVPDGMVPSVQSKAHVMVLPLTKVAGNTSIPSKLLAYLFSARPVIALAQAGTDIEGIIRESDCGWVGEPENNSWLINCFQKIEGLSNECLIEKGQKGHQYASKYFSRNTNLKKLVESIIN